MLEPGGVFVVIAEAYRGNRDFLQAWVMRAMRTALMSADEHRAWLTTAGFDQVQVFEQRNHGWICVTGRRPG